MRCPICRIDMIKEKFGDVRVGLCKNGCHGIWITYKDLIRIAKKNEGFGASFNEALNTPGTGKSGRGQILCPECQIPMHVHKYRSTINIVVDECYKCGGFFLDPGELKGIREAFRKSEEKELYVQFLLKDIPGYSQMKLDSAKLEDRANAIKSFTDFRYLNLPFTDIPLGFPVVQAARPNLDLIKSTNRIRLKKDCDLGVVVYSVYWLEPISSNVFSLQALVWAYL